MVLLLILVSAVGLFIGGVIFGVARGDSPSDTLFSGLIFSCLMVPFLVFRQQWRSAKVEDDDAASAEVGRGKARFYGFLYSLLVLGPIFAGAFAKSLVEGLPARDGFLIALGGVGIVIVFAGVIWLLQLLQRYIERD